MPGLIEGASEGVGLGHEFLAHLERARLLVHVIDAAEGDPAGALPRDRPRAGRVRRRPRRAAADRRPEQGRRRAGRTLAVAFDDPRVLRVVRTSARHRRGDRRAQAARCSSSARRPSRRPRTTTGSPSSSSTGPTRRGAASASSAPIAATASPGGRRATEELERGAAGGRRQARRRGRGRAASRSSSSDDRDLRRRLRPASPGARGARARGQAALRARPAGGARGGEPRAQGGVDARPRTASRWRRRRSPGDDVRRGRARAHRRHAPRRRTGQTRCCSSGRTSWRRSRTGRSRTPCSTWLGSASPRDRATGSEELAAALDQLGRPDRFELFEIEPWPVASRELRARVARGESLDGLVPAGRGRGDRAPRPLPRGVMSA